MTAPVRIVLVDDQALFRAGIRMVIDSQPDLEVVGEASDGREGIEVVRAPASRCRRHGCAADRRYAPGR